MQAVCTRAVHVLWWSEGSPHGILCTFPGGVACAFLELHVLAGKVPAAFWPSGLVVFRLSKGSAEGEKDARHLIQLVVYRLNRCTCTGSIRIEAIMSYMIAPTLRASPCKHSSFPTLLCFDCSADVNVSKYFRLICCQKSTPFIISDLWWMKSTRSGT